MLTALCVKSKILKIILSWILNQCNSLKTGVMWLRRGIRFKIRAAWFCIRCNLSICLFGSLSRILLQKYKRLVIKAWISCAVASKVRKFRILPMPRKWKWVDLQIPLIWSWKVRYRSKTTPRSLTLENGETCISPTLTDKSLKFYFKSGDRKIINSVLDSLIFNLFLIIHTRISEIHMFNFVNDSKDPYT